VRTINAGIDDGDANTGTPRDAPCPIYSVIGNPILALANLVSVGGRHRGCKRDSHQKGEKQRASP
jgi:hypothetical protein